MGDLSKGILGIYVFPQLRFVVKRSDFGAASEHPPCSAHQPRARAVPSRAGTAPAAKKTGMAARIGPDQGEFLGPTHPLSCILWQKEVISVQHPRASSLQHPPGARECFPSAPNLKPGVLHHLPHSWGLDPLNPCPPHPHLQPRQPPQRPARLSISIHGNSFHLLPGRGMKTRCSPQRGVSYGEPQLFNHSLAELGSPPRPPGRSRRY